MVWLFVTILLGVFLLSLILSQGNIACPPVVFSFGFLFQSIWVLIYEKSRGLEIQFRTFFVIIIGVVVFCISSLIISLLVGRDKNLKNNSPLSETLMPININRLLEVCCALFLVVFIAVYIRYIQRAVGITSISLHSISDAIGEYDRVSKFTDSYNTVKLPFLISNLVTFVIAGGYWFEYVILNNFFSDKKINILEVCTFLLCAATSVISGSRTPLFMMMVAGVSYAIIIVNKDSRRRGVNTRIIAVTALIGTLFVVSFLSFGVALGRDISKGPMEYLFVYCGAEVKNLDIFLGNIQEMRNNNIWGSQTFFSLVKTVGEKIGFEGYKPYSLDLPFQSYYGQDLGNVYTTFFPYIYDFGYPGMIILVMIMGMISQLCYEKSMMERSGEMPGIWSLAYGIVFGCLILSFFSNKFYETVFSMSFLKRLIAWMLLNILFSGRITIDSVKERN